MGLASPLQVCSGVGPYYSGGGEALLKSTVLCASTVLQVVHIRPSGASHSHCPSQRDRVKNSTQLFLMATVQSLERLLDQFSVSLLSCPPPSQIGLLLPLYPHPCPFLKLLLMSWALSSRLFSWSTGAGKGVSGPNQTRVHVCWSWPCSIQWHCHRLHALFLGGGGGWVTEVSPRPIALSVCWQMGMPFRCQKS